MRCGRSKIKAAVVQGFGWKRDRRSCLEALRREDVAAGALLGAVALLASCGALSLRSLSSDVPLLLKELHPTSEGHRKNILRPEAQSSRSYLFRSPLRWKTSLPLFPQRAAIFYAAFRVGAACINSFQYFASRAWRLELQRQPRSFVKEISPLWLSWTTLYIFSLGVGVLLGAVARRCLVRLSECRMQQRNVQARGAAGL